MKDEGWLGDEKRCKMEVINERKVYILSTSKPCESSVIGNYFLGSVNSLQVTNVKIVPKKVG